MAKSTPRPVRRTAPAESTPLTPEQRRQLIMAPISVRVHGGRSWGGAYLGEKQIPGWGRRSVYHRGWDDDSDFHWDSPAEEEGAD